jgi:5-formyltetrahydrofolate cyclo-ligase
MFDLIGAPGDKAQLRKQLIEKRRSLPPAIWREKSEALCQRLQSLPLFAEARTVLAYFSIRQEPDLHSLFTRDRHWGFSRCVGRSLVWHSWMPGEALQRGNYGILEPHPDAPVLSPSEVDVMLVPAVACDAQGYRLGYGGGFYDRLLSSPEWVNILTIGIIFELAYLPQLPIDPWDSRLHAVCTETRTLEF